MAEPKASLLEIRRLHVWVRLGCSAEERSIAQEVEFDLAIRFPESPKGGATDRLEDTLCYAEICAQVVKAAQSRPFLLVESLAQETWDQVKALPTRQSFSLALRVHKIRPPIETLRGGVKYQYGDFEWSFSG